MNDLDTRMAQWAEWYRTARLTHFLWTHARPHPRPTTIPPRRRPGMGMALLSVQMAESLAK